MNAIKLHEKESFASVIFVKIRSSDLNVKAFTERYVAPPVERWRDELEIRGLNFVAEH